MELDAGTADDFGVPYAISYRDVKHPRLELRTGHLLLVLPRGTDAATVLERHQTWISKKTAFIEECLQDSADKELVERSDEEFKQLVGSQINLASARLDVEVNKVLFRKMKTKWASCSTKKNLTVNTLMRYLLEHLVEYVIFHEIAHLIEKKHNDRFWRIIAEKYPNHNEHEKELFAHWFLIQAVTG